MQLSLRVLKQALILTFLLTGIGVHTSIAQTVNVTITQNGGQTDPTNVSPVVFQAQFSEDVSGFGAEVADVTVSGTAGATTAVVAGGPSIYTVTVTGMTGPGTVIITIPANAATAVAAPAGRQNVVSTNTDNSVTYDATAPTITASSIINNTTGTQFTLRVNANENSTVYYVVTTSSTPPTAAQVIAGQNDTGTAAFASGNAAATATVNLDQVINGLTTGTLYHIYSVARDALTNTSAVDAESATATDTTAPTITASSIHTIGSTSFTHRTNVNENSTVFYVVTTSSTPPSVAQVLAGQNEGGTAAFKSGSAAATAGVDLDQPITGLGLTTLYYVYAVARDASSNSSAVDQESATTVDTNPPVIVSKATDLLPFDGENGVSTNTPLVLTFDEPVLEATAAPGTTDEDEIRIYRVVGSPDPNPIVSGNDVLIETIARNDGDISIAGNVVTIDINNLSNNEDYYIIIGNKVFKDAAGNNFAGYASSADWNFETSAGVTITQGTAGACVGTYNALSTITITENGNNDISSGGTVTLDFSGTGYIFEPNASLSTSRTGDVSAVTASTTFTTLTLNITTTGTNSKSTITVSGIRVSSSSASNPSRDIVRVGGTATIANGGVGADFGTVSSGTSPSSPTVTFPSGDNSFCVNETFTGITVTASDPDPSPETFNWYNDAGLTVLNTAGVSTRTVAQLIGGSPTPGTYTRYVTQVDGCESAATTITIIVTALPVANAGGNLTGVNAVCPGTNITLGGSPTATGGSGSYTYTWTGSGSPGAVPNPVQAMPNPGGSNQTYPYQVIVTDANNCSSLPSVKQIEVKTISQSVTFTSPTQFNYADNDDPVDLTSNVTGGVFSGVGVVAVGTSPISYKFDPELAGAAGVPYPVTYTVTLANGCSKTISQDFTVSPSGSIIPQLPTNGNFCTSEDETAILTLSTYYQNILTSANYSLIRFESDQGGVFYVGPNPNNYRFYPGSSVTGQNRIYAVIRYNLDPVDPAYEFRWVSQTVTINQTPYVNFTGITNMQNICANDVEIPLTGNYAAGSFDISITGADGTFAPGFGITPTTPGQANFNAFDAWVAYGSTATNITRHIRYIYDPGTVGSDGEACSNEQVIPIVIVPPPPLTFTGATDANNTQYCFDAADRIVGVSQSSGVSFSGYGIVDRGNGTAVFDPSAAFTQKEIADGVTHTTNQTITVTAIYTNTEGCQRTISRDFIVKPLPAATFTFTGSGDYCYEGATFIVDGDQPSGSYVIRYLTVSRPDTTITVPDFPFDPSFYFDKAVQSDPTSLRKTHEYQLTYTASASGCSNTMVRTFKVSPSYEVAIAGIEDGEIYCGNAGARTITFTPSGGVFTLTQTFPSTVVENPNLINDNTYFFTKTQGTFEFSYVITSGTSCTNSTTKTVRLLPSPKAEFAFQPRCNGDLITYLAQNNTASFDSLYSWSFGDSVLTGQSVDFRFPLTDRLNSSPVKLKVEYKMNLGLVCADSILHTQVIGPYPDIDIIFSNVCKDDMTSFEIDTNYPIERAAWNFGDGNTLNENTTNVPIPGGTHGGLTQGTYGEPEHRYTTTGTQSFDVTLNARSPAADGACLTSLTKKVPILERVTASPSNPYVMSEYYEDDKGLWIDEDIASQSTWKFSTAAALSKAIIKDETEDSLWVTNATSIYNANDISFVNSPCFNLSSFTKPVISLDYWVNTEAKDGAVLQYSTNGGLDWFVLGNQTTGLEWFNTEDISSDPGQQSQYGELSQLGWSGKTQNAWVTAKNSLDGVGLNNIRFRIAFSSDANDQFDGFAFKNVKIEERNRIMLIEHFTNTNEATTSKQNFNNIGSAEVVKIQYHTGFPGPAVDPLNQRNPQDNNARGAFYGLTDQSVPLAVIDGHRNGSFSFANNWYEDYIEKRSLSASPYELTVETLPSEGENWLTVRVTIDSIGQPHLKPVLHIAIVERQNGTNQYVLKKLMPNAAGTLIPNPILDEFVFVDSIRMMDSNYDRSQIAIVAFIQDEITRDVYQANILNSPTLSHIPDPDVITGVESDSYAKRIYVYPNPASHVVNIELPAAVIKPTPVTLTDAFGRVVREVVFDTGEKSKIISTSSLADGMYMMQIITPQGNKAVRKVMVKH